MSIVLFLFCCTMFFFVIWRFFAIFHNNSKIIPLIIAVILAIIVVSTFMYMGNSKVLDIIGTLSTWIFVIGFILMILLLFEYLVSTRYKINPRIIVGIIVVIFGLGTYFSLHTKITNLNIETNKVYKDTKILLLSDIHAENVTQSFHINKIRKMIESERPDIVLIAGDLMNKANKGYIKYFNNIEPEKAKPVPYYNPQQYNPPIFAVMGNHDVMGDKNVIKEIGKNSNIRLLDNEAIINLNGTTTGCGSAADYHFEKEIPDLTCPGTIRIIGLRDKSLWGDENIDSIMHDILTPKSPIQKDYTDYKYDGFTILMTHQPISLEKLKDYPIDLEVAGHTHRGQFYGMRKIVEWMNDYAYGEYKLGDRTAFVTQGIGTWGLPFRLGTQSEMVIINLIKK